MASVLERSRAAISAFFDPGTAPTVSNEDGRYYSLYAFWAGDWQRSNMLADQRVSNKSVYKNTRQLWRQASAVVDLYDQFVYAGDLPTNTEPLPDGTQGAIPLNIQVPTEEQAEALHRAIAEWWSMTNFRQFMSMRPKFGAILGDVLTELIDDRAQGAVRPQLIWPGFVKYLDLDLAGNVKAYSLEWDVTEPETRLFGSTQTGRSYTYRKDVNSAGVWEYENDQLVRSRENPYGFVPAIWDRHEIVFGDRGIGAIDRTFQQAVEMNSILSNALDYQGRQFGAPVGVKGSSLGTRNSPIKMNPRATTGDPMADAAMVAQSLGLLPMTDNGDFVTINFDVGKTVDMLSLVMDSILAENPEARYSQQILDMTQVTAPGVERALGPIIGRVKAARKNYDPQTVKLLQMAVSMTGWRVNTGGYDDRYLVNRKARYDAFRPFDLTSYDKGLLDFTIPDREVIPETLDERIARQVVIEGLQWEYSLRISGMPPDEINKIIAEREAESQRQARLDEIMTVGVDPDTGQPPQSASEE